MANLPILQYEETIVETVEQNPVVVVIGETGSGKSTQLSQILHRHGYTKSGIIGVTQPRRVAAVSVARLLSQNVNSSMHKLNYINLMHKLNYINLTVFFIFFFC